MPIVASRDEAPNITDGIIQIDLPDITAETGWKSYYIVLSDYITPSGSKTIRIVTEADANETGDNGNIIEFNSASNFNFTFDEMSTGYFSDLITKNTGVVTLTAGAGVTLHYENANRKMDTPITGVSIYYSSPTDVMIVGKLSA